MKSKSKRLFALAAFLLGGSVSGLAAAKALPCADYITTSFEDGPDSGFLIGTSTRTDQIKYGGNAVVASLDGTSIETWEVGTYQLSDGRRVRIDCRDYTLA